MAEIKTEDGVIYTVDDEKSNEQVEAEETVDGLLASLGGSEEVIVYLYRLHPNKEKSFIAQMQASEFSLEMLRDDYDGGRFQLIIKQGGRAVRTKRVSVEPPKKKDQTAMVPYQQGQDNTTNLIFTMMQENQRRSDDLLKVLLGKENPKPNYSWPELITAFGTVLPTLTKFFGKQSPDNQIDIFMKALELGRSLDGDKDLSMTELMGKGLEALSQVVGQAKTNPTQQSQTSAEGEETKQLESQPIGEQAMMVLMKNKLNPLVEAAKENEDPWPYVGVIFNKAPAEYIKAWIIDQQDPIAALSKVHSEISNYRAWFEKLVEGIREEWAEAEREAQGDGGETDITPD